MSNTLLTISTITREATMVLENNLTFAKGANRDYDDKFAVAGAKVGDTVNARKPPRYIGRSGQTLKIENSVETSVPVVLSTQFGVDIQFSSKDLLLNIDDFSKRFIKPAMAVVANKIDRDGLLLYQTVANCVGTGAALTDLDYFLKGKALLSDAACPQDGQLSTVLAPWTEASMVQGLKGLFHSSSEISSQYETGNMGMAAGQKFSMDQNVYNHVYGVQGGTPLIDGAAVSGSSFLTKGWTSAAAVRLNKGDVFTITGVYAVNPQTRETTNQLRRFVVTSAFSSDGSGSGSIQVYPPLTVAGTGVQAPTVAQLPADAAPLTILGTTGQVVATNLIYHPAAFTLASADLPLPGGVDMAARVSSKKVGLSVRMVRAYDIVNDIFPCRLDVLYGWAAIYPELACRVQGL